jgi:hypothetical protein
MRGVEALRRFWIAGGALALGLALSACADQPSPILSAASGSGPAAAAPGQAEAATAPRLAPRPGVSPAGASVAFISFDGPPPAVTSRFHAAMGRALGAADVTTAPSTSAHYLVQGHLSAWPGEKGVALSWVWDVFDARRARVQRIEDQIDLRAAGADPWAAVDDAALEAAARRSAEDLAAFLTHTPQAQSQGARAPVR